MTFLYVILVHVFLFSIFQGNRQEQEKLLLVSTTLYVGNLSYYTTEEQIHELFSKCGDIKRIIMGLDKVRKTPCGFCFVEYPCLKSDKMMLGFAYQEQNYLYSNNIHFVNNYKPCFYIRGGSKHFDKEGCQPGFLRKGGGARILFTIFCQFYIWKWQIFQ